MHCEECHNNSRVLWSNNSEGLQVKQLHLNNTCRSQAYILSHVSTTASMYLVLKLKQTKFTDLSHVNKRLKYCTLWYYRLAHEKPAQIK